MDAAAEATGMEAAAPEVSGMEAAAPFTPAVIQSKLTFWFDPTSLVQTAGKVVAWTDLSANGNDATQSDSAYQPAYTAAGIHGLPSATFSGPVTFLRITDVAAMRWGRDDLVVLVVARATAQSAADCMLYQKTGPFPYDGVNLFLNADKPMLTGLAAAEVSGQVYVVSSPPPTTFLDGTVHLIGIRRAGATLEIRIDGAVSSSIANASVASVDVSAIGSDAIIGQNGLSTPLRARPSSFTATSPRRSVSTAR